VIDFNPEVIFCVLLGYELWIDTLDIARKLSRCLIINWGTDDSWRYRQFSRLVAPSFDAYVTTYESALCKARSEGYQNIILTQWAANSINLNPPLPASECRFQVSFVGTAYGNRPKWVSALREHGITVDCFGYGWENGPIAAKDIPCIMRESKISLNFGDSGIVLTGLVPHRDRQIKARIFEVPGSGGFLLTEGAKGIDKFYVPGEELVIFDTFDSLVSKITYFLSHPEKRDQIACAGFQRTCKEHTYEQRFGEILAYACSEKRRCNVSTYENLVDYKKEYLQLVDRHSAGFLLKILKRMLLVPCVLIWGKRKGPRAARKILFEISWRIFGKKTYTAAGLPGRLFYRES